MTKDQQPTGHQYQLAQEVKERGYPSGRTPADQVQAPAAALRPSPRTPQKDPAPADPPATGDDA